jgi:hypothetical protein
MARRAKNCGRSCALALCYGVGSYGKGGRRRIKTVEERSYLLWAWGLILALGVIDWLWAKRAGLTFVGWAKPAYMLGVLFGISFLYSYKGRDRRLSDAADFAALWVAFSLAGAIFTYLAATVRMPLHDAQFAAIDAALGFHWVLWFGAVLAHPWIHVPLAAAYGSFLPQIVGSIIYFAHSGQTRRNIELIWIAMLSLMLATVISGLLPSLGPYVHFTNGTSIYLVTVMTLRAPGPHIFALRDLTGIIKLPSFHTVLAVVFVYVHRPPSRSFVPVAVLNALMLLAIPSEGHHYLIDMIAGGAVAAVTIAIFRSAAPDKLREPRLAARRRTAI